MCPSQSSTSDDYQEYLRSQTLPADSKPPIYDEGALSNERLPVTTPESVFASRTVDNRNVEFPLPTVDAVDSTNLSSQSTGNVAIADSVTLTLSQRDREHNECTLRRRKKSQSCVLANDRKVACDLPDSEGESLGSKSGLETDSWLEKENLTRERDCRNADCMTKDEETEWHSDGKLRDVKRKLEYYTRDADLMKRNRVFEVYDEIRRSSIAGARHCGSSSPEMNVPQFFKEEVKSRFPPMLGQTKFTNGFNIDKNFEKKTASALNELSREKYNEESPRRRFLKQTCYFRFNVTGENGGKRGSWCTDVDDYKMGRSYVERRRSEIEARVKLNASENETLVKSRKYSEGSLTFSKIPSSFLFSEENYCNDLETKGLYSKAGEKMTSWSNAKNRDKIECLRGGTIGELKIANENVSEPSEIGNENVCDESLELNIKCHEKSEDNMNFKHQLNVLLAKKIDDHLM